MKFEHAEILRRIIQELKELERSTDNAKAGQCINLAVSDLELVIVEYL